MALAIFSDELLPQYFTENTRQDFRLSAGKTKIASKGKSSQLYILKMRRIMAERWIRTEFTAAGGVHRFGKRIHASIVRASRENNASIARADVSSAAMRTTQAFK